MAKGDQKMTPLIRANVLVLGKTGVGKTALCNYIFGQEIFKTGSGRPVTGMGLFEQEVTLESGLVLHLYDSWGMEADKTKAWKELIDQALKKHQGRKIEDWFHTIIFCISAKSARVECFEVEMIKSLKNSGNPVIIALTHADVSEKEGSILAMRGVLVDKAGILDENIIEVNSVEKTLLGGRKTKTFGKKEILKRIQINLLEMIKKRVPQTLRAFGQAKINGWFEDCRQIIIENVSFFNPVSKKKEKDRNAFFNAYARSVLDEIDAEAKMLFYQALDYFLAFSQGIGGEALVVTLSNKEMLPFIQFQLEKNARLGIDIMGNFFIFIPVLGAVGKQIIRKKSQRYYLDGLKEYQALLRHQLDQSLKIVEEELEKIEASIKETR